MAKQTINLGTMADNKSGDPLRTAFTKINQNFDELYTQIGGGVGVNVGDQTTEPSQVTDIVFDGATVENIDGVSTVTITQPTIPTTGVVTFDGTAVVGGRVGAAGTIIAIGTNYLGDTPGVNSTAVQVDPTIPGLDQVTDGWVIRMATGEVRTLVAAYHWTQSDNFWVLQWDQNYQTSDPVYPLTVESPDYQAGDATHLVLTSGATSPGSAIDIKETEIDMNFTGGNGFKFSPQGLVFPDQSVQTTANAGGGSGGYSVGLTQYNGDWHPNAPNIFDLNDWVPYDVTVFAQNGAGSDISVILPDNFTHGKMITIKCADWTNLDYNLVISSNHNIDNVSQTVSTQKNGGFVTFVWDDQWTTWWIIGKDI